MEFKDYYAILEINRNATQEEIKIAYRKLAWKYHPDRNKGDLLAEEKLKDVNEAFRVLSDANKRRRYDSQWKTFSFKTPKSSSPKANEAFSNRFTSLFRKVFNQETNDVGKKKTKDDILPKKPESRQNPSQNTKKDTTPVKPKKLLEYPVSVTLKEAFEGTERTVQIGGKGIAVKIPPGVKTGTHVKVRLSNKANESANEVHLLVEVLHDERYKRDGDDLYMEINVNLYTAILGGSVPIETFHGKGVLTIPAGTQPDQIFRLKGKGMPRLHQLNEYGDLYIKVKIRLPEQLTDHQKALFELLASSG